MAHEGLDRVRAKLLARLDSTHMNHGRTQRSETPITVLFLGANQDSFATGTKLNLPTGNIRNFDATDGGIAAALDLASHAIAQHRDHPRTERQTRRTKLFDQIEPPSQQ